MISFVAITFIWLYFGLYTYNMGRKLDKDPLNTLITVQHHYYFDVKRKFSIAIILTIVVLFVSIPFLCR